MEFPPNLRDAESCAFCQHFGAEEDTCELFQTEVTQDQVCDAFAESED
jgi:hypothetical protein